VPADRRSTRFLSGRSVFLDPGLTDEVGPNAARLVATVAEQAGTLGGSTTATLDGTDSTIAGTNEIST
jgi:hypothetical protein